MKFLKGIDWYIIFSVIVLGALSLAIISSVAPAVFVAQVIFFFISVVLIFVFSQIDLEVFTPFIWFIYLLICIGLFVTDILGFASHGAVRWISIFGFNVQVSEIGKPLLLIVFAYFLTRYPLAKWQNFIKFSLLYAIPVLLILRQPDLGSSLVYVFAYLAMCFFAQLPIITIAMVNIVALVLAPAAWNFLKDYQRQRIISFINPHVDPLGASYNAIQATIAAGSGMIWGKGLGHGSQSQLLFLPEKHTDFIFASLVEELGFVGGFLVLLCLTVIIWRILKLVAKVDAFSTLFLFGVVAMFFCQTFVNIGMNIGLVPVTGITLPFVSYGGSSLIAMGIMLGLVQSIAKKVASGYNTGYEIGSY